MRRRLEPDRRTRKRFQFTTCPRESQIGRSIRTRLFALQKTLTLMTIYKNRKRPSLAFPMPLLSALIALLAIVTSASSSLAQQGQFQPSNPPPNQSQGGGVLELPRMPAPQGGGSSATIPPMAPQPGQELTVPTRQLKSQQGYQQVTVTVTDQEGRYVTGLQKGDFKLSIDGKDRPIEFFRQDLNAPVSIGILVDTSGSMQPKIPQAQAAISEFVRNLNERDDVFMFAFSSRPFLLQPFTTNHYLVLSRLELLHAFGQTSLYDTILDGLLMVQHGRYDKKALLVVTDGMDNTSQSTVDQVVAQARRMGVLVYSIGIGDPNAANLPGIALGPFLFGGDVDQVDARTLSTLSTETGAKTYIIREVGDGETLRAACATISRELREQYTVGFVTPDASRGGYRALHVDVPTHPEDSVRVRKGVDVSGGTESAAATPPG
jgi:Ca-activated chloride channel family protein